jgi:hypothetical protein
VADSGVTVALATERARWDASASSARTRLLAQAARSIGATLCLVAPNTSPAVHEPATEGAEPAGMTAPDLHVPPAHPGAPFAVSPAGLLASALLHVLDRDEPPPARWRADPFVAAVASHRTALTEVYSVADLDVSAPASAEATFRGAVAALASDPLAAALAVRRLELLRGSPLPAWPVIVRHGAAPRVTPADQGRWFG